MTVKVFFVCLFFVFCLCVAFFYPVYWTHEGFSDYNIHFPIFFVDRLKVHLYYISIT